MAAGHHLSVGFELVAVVVVATAVVTATAMVTVMMAHRENGQE